MPSLPITFTYNNKQWQGELSEVAGTGGLWHLYVKKYYLGQLFKTKDGWQFYSQKEGSMPELAKVFGEAVEASNS